MLYLVFGGELKSLEGDEFRDMKSVDCVGLFDDYQEALLAWRGKAQQTVDSAATRYYLKKIETIV